MISSEGFFELKCDNPEHLVTYLNSHQNIKNTKVTDDLITAFLDAPMSASAFNKELIDNGIALSHLVLRKESLEEQFLQLTDNLEDQN